MSLYESERAARIAAEHRLGNVEQQLAASQQQVDILEKRIDAAEQRLETAAREHGFAAQNSAVRDYVMASAHCLLWYAEICETNEFYLDWRMEFPNEESARGFLPLEIKAGEKIEDAWYWRRHPADRDECDRLGTAAMRAGESYQQDFRCYCEDGSMRWLHEDVHVETIASGERWRAVGVCTDVTAQQQLRTRMQAANKRLKSSIAETHHRVKNNLQVVAALVDLLQSDARQLAETHSAMRRMGQHIRALAAMHDLLTSEAQAGADLDSVPVRAVFERLVELVRQTLVAGQTINARFADMRLASRQVTALIILINELVSNALKHARSEVTIVVEVRHGFVCVEVSDDGPGFPAGFDPHAAGTHGLEIVESISRLDLQTALRYETLPQGGARVSLEFLAGRS